MFRHHIAAIPADISEDLVDVDSQITPISIYEKLIELSASSLNASSGRLEKEEWSGLLPKATSFIGDVLGALFPGATSSPESGGYELETARKWRHSEHNIQISIVPPKYCARDDPRHILAPAAMDVAKDRIEGWQVIVLPESLVESVAETVTTETIRKRIRRARILHKLDDCEPVYNTILNQFKEIFR
jgi:hypothetical protein